MKTKILVLVFAFLVQLNSYSIVDWSATYVIPHSYGTICNGQEYVEVGFFTNFEINNATFQIQRSQDPSFSSVITGTSQFNGNFNGCGTCSGTQYTILDYGPFLPGEVWHYRVEATSNSVIFSYKELGTYTVTIPTIVNWINQVTSSVTIGNSPSNELSYAWYQEIRDMQGVGISLMQTDISKIYLEQNNNKLAFNVDAITPFINLEVSVDNFGYFNLYNGSPISSFIWENSSAYFSFISNHNLKVKFTSTSGNSYIREYNVFVVPKSDALYVDNYCNTMRVWKGNDPTNGRPLILSEGFDAYNTKSEQYYRETGKDLINCLLNKGFDIYVVNYNLNSQSIKNNAAIFQSAIRYVSSINDDRLVIATGMSMGGVINRYACTKAENDGNPLPLSKFVTLDAPQQGAIISSTLQDWRKDLTVGDSFSEHASNNDGAKELLNYNAYDPSGAIHNLFFSDLNSLNGDGYPHLVEKIGVSFSTSNPNPNSGEWLFVHVTGAPGNNNEHFYLTPEELVPGSFLPKINSDPIAATSSSFFASFVLSVLRPFSDPTVSVIEYADPTFIPHNSSLDIISGISKFDKTIQPTTTSYHDIVPDEIIEPLLNLLINKDVYVQNVNYNSDRTVIASESIYAGNQVTTSIPAGDVNVMTGADITFKAGVQIQLLDGFNVNSGGNFTAVIEEVKCDGEIEYQNRTMNSNSGAYLRNTQNIIPYEKNNEEKTVSINTELGIFPNPTEGILNIKNVLLEKLSYIILTTQGIPIKAGTIENNNQIDIRNLISGIYVLTIMNSNKNKIKQFKVIKN